MKVYKVVETFKIITDLGNCATLITLEDEKGYLFYAQDIQHAVTSYLPNNKRTYFLDTDKQVALKKLSDIADSDLTA